MTIPTQTDAELFAVIEELFEVSNEMFRCCQNGQPQSAWMPALSAYKAAHRKLCDTKAATPAGALAKMRATLAVMEKLDSQMDLPRSAIEDALRLGVKASDQSSLSAPAYHFSVPDPPLRLPGGKP